MKKVGNNPIIENMGVCDPHVHVFNGRAYMYTTHDDGPGHDNYTMYDWRVFSSDDLVSWRLESVLKPEDTYLGPVSECYATDAAERNGKYYFYFSHQQYSTGVAVSAHPGGPFRDALGKALLPRGLVDTACYDPTVFIDDDEARTPYIIFGYTVLGKSYYIARLNEDMISLAEPPRPIVIENGWQNDATWMTKRGDTYYLSSHEACYATSKNIYGPYAARQPFYKDAHADHGTFFEFHRQNYFAYGVPENWGEEKVDPFYRTTKLAYVNYRANGDIVVDPRSCRVGVAQYDAAWGDIPAAWYFHATAGLRKVELGDEFVVSGCGGDERLTFPHFRGIPENPRLILRIRPEAEGSSRVRALADGVALGQVSVEPGGDFREISMPLTLSAGEHEIALAFQGPGLTLAALRFEA